MRGHIGEQPEFISLINVDNLIGREHPIRRIKKMVDEVLVKMSRRFEAMYASHGRPSIPPEQLLKAKVLQALYTVRSDRQLCVRMQTDLLFRWFIDLGLDEEVFDASTFSQNQQRLLQHEVADTFFAEVVKLAKVQGWISDDHFSVDGTLIEGWASMKSFRPKGDDKPGDGTGWSDFRGQKRSNDTHESTTDPETKLTRKGNGQEAKLCFGAHSVMENRNGLCVLFDVRPAIQDCSESRVAVEQLRRLKRRGYRPQSVGADKGYHSRHFVESLRRLKIKPHPALLCNRNPMGVILNAAHQASQRVRKRIEEIFGWVKTVGGFRKSRYRGVARTHAASPYVVASLNLLRMAKLQRAT